MDMTSYPLSIRLEVWPGYGYFIELEQSTHCVYSLYWIPESKLEPIMDAIKLVAKDQLPLAGDKILIDFNDDKDKKP